MTAQKTGTAQSDTASFGFQTVPLGDKQGLVNDVFHKVAERYDLMNDLMSGGMHRLWKDAMIAWLCPPKSGKHSYRTIDVAGGTGDIAFRIVEASRGSAHVRVTDINESMLRVGKDRAKARSLSKQTDFVVGNAEDLPYGPGEFDAYTIAFGIRNVPRIDKALREAHRVLKRGGRFMCLEFSEVEMPVLDKVYDAFSFGAIPKIGEMVTGDGQPYQYLVESIRQFPNQHRFGAMIEEAGFSRVTWRNLSGGIAAIHSGYKL
ncbi:bifunctional demethylmenaquinone methyltransferase/2-methoxy-6-polyprenyl-1,4-benzoquinol methylase UbiE [Coralliovum pocilloporae]|uniref:bifunctional demethylmenaquinone methyltransferase/2-methoxy-6-polyprenyl-1,4-benzoquinol methylase UbiE n=1 Tax=Coralliovum pocilloporae TaxID=3066369 RepID=UPI003307A718